MLLGKIWCKPQICAAPLCLVLTSNTKAVKFAMQKYITPSPAGRFGRVDNGFGKSHKSFANIKQSNHCTIGLEGQCNFKKYKKWAKVSTCFSFKKPPISCLGFPNYFFWESQTRNLLLFEILMTQNLRQILFGVFL